ncbi:peptidoglycan recognition protein family protein [Streptomyces pristinaespiralis]|uniref:peptidoglycan recognition protein family protein n=1 Tax=Streptomyces pristinaespiralis TaxID=38300 RepID=UPI003838EC89
MRGYLASSVGVACATALVIPLSFASGALAAPLPAAAVQQAPDVPGSTQSLPLKALGQTPSERSPGTPELGLPEQDVDPFSLVGVVWEDAFTELDGTVEVRTRAAGSGVWSDWQQVETHNSEHAADPGTVESDARSVRGSTAPLWVGPSDGVEVRVRAADGSSSGLPEGMRLELVDPGDDPATADPDTDIAPDTDTAPEPDTGQAAAGPDTEPTVGRSPLGGLEIPALNQSDTEAEAAAAGDILAGDLAAGAKPYIGPRPRIVTRKGWGADESWREKKFVYTGSVKAAFVHHSATGNNYTCKEAPSVIRSIYRYHVKSSGWRDIGYNFAVDKCGNIYEGRAGGVAKPVLGAHTLGFNTNSTGIAVLGTYSSSNPPQAAVTAVAKLTAWKLGLHGINPSGKVTLTSAGSGKYAKGVKVKLNAISGHRDGYVTDCPGGRLYSKLGTARTAAAKLQGR